MVVNEIDFGRQYIQDTSVCYKTFKVSSFLYIKIFVFRRDAFDLRYSVGILRLQEGFDVNKVPDDQVALADEIESDEENAYPSDDEGRNIIRDCI